MIFLSLLFSCCLAFAAGDMQQIWNLPYAGEKPVAAFFDASSGSLFVSVRDANGYGRLDRVSLEGKLEKKGMATAKGEPGPVRGYLGKLYWVAGPGSVQIVDPKGGRDSVPGVPGAARASAIALGRNGEVYLVLEGKSLYRVAEGKTKLLRTGKKITGLFLLLDRLYLLDDGRIVSLEKLGNEEKAEGKLCDCRGLEKTSLGDWLSTRGNELTIAGKAALTLQKGPLGHPAYVYRMDTRDDFVVIPVPEEGMLRAYRMPGVGKAP